jgi:hypothetical protein
MIASTNNYQEPFGCEHAPSGAFEPVHFRGLLMNHAYHSWTIWGLRLLTLLCGGGLFIGAILAQEEGFQDAKQPSNKEERRFRELQNGKFEPPLTAEDKDIIDRWAKWYANRLTFPQYQGVQVAEGDTKQPTDKRTMYQIVDEAIRQILIPEDPAKPLSGPKQEYQKELGKAMTKYLKKVVRNEKPITRVNAARLLAHLCKAGSDEAADLLVEVIKDPNENDGIKLWAARGLREGLAVKQPDAKRENTMITTLLESLKQRASRTAMKPSDEEDADRFVRREVIRALGEARRPEITAGGQVEVPAWWLLRIARKDNVKPEPNLSEQIEAAIAVCQLQPKLSKDYNLDYVAHQVGWFIVEFAGHSNNRLNLSPPNNGASIAWKVQAARLALALDKLQEGAASAPKDVATMVGNLVTNAKRVLGPIEAGKPPTVTALETWLQGNRPKTATSVVKSDTKTTITVPEPGK